MLQNRREKNALNDLDYKPEIIAADLPRIYILTNHYNELGITGIFTKT
jgi:hypothetical protein